MWKTVTAVEEEDHVSDRRAMVRLRGPRTWQPPSSRPAEAGTRSEVHPPLSAYLCSYQGSDLLVPILVGRRAWAVIQVGRGRVAVVVVGVTPHQGGMESIPQGEEPQVKAFQALKVRRWETS